MPTVGPIICGIGADNGGRGDVWNNPQFITQNDGQFATVLMQTGEFSNELQAFNYGFSIPSNATIIGIKVDVNKKATGGTCADGGAFLFFPLNTNVGNDKSIVSNWPSSATTVSYGGPSDLWGLTSTFLLSIINNSNFGFDIVANQVSGVPTAAVDFIQMTVTYSVPAAATGDYFLGGRHAESRFILPGRGIG